MNELHSYKLLGNKADCNKEYVRVYGAKYKKSGNSNIQRIFSEGCQRPSTDAGPGGTAGKTQGLWSHEVFLLVR